MKLLLKKIRWGRRPVVRAATGDDLQSISAIQSGAPEGSHWQPGDYFSYQCQVAEFRGRVAAFLVSRRIAEGQREILNVAVDSTFRRRGLGILLLKEELRRWPGEHFLEVRKSNHAARSLYRKIGFEETGERPGYYENPPETAIVMRILS